MPTPRRTAPANVHSICHSRTSALAGLLVLLLARPGAAHVPILHGRLIDLIRRSDVIVLGTAEQVKPAGARFIDTDLSVEDTFTNAPPEQTLTFRGPSGIAPGERYVVFLQRTASGFESIQPSGTLFPSRPADDAGYRDAVTSISQALRGDAAQQVAVVRAALIAALSASAPPLRYHAALELAALAHDGYGPTEAEQQRLTTLLASPTVDPALRPLLTSIAATP